MKRCTYCGKEYPDNASTCAIDGKPLVKFPPEPEPEPAPDKLAGEEITVTIEIFQTREAANLAVAKLEAYGISCWLKSDDAGGMYPNLAMVGGIRLQVRAAEAEAATALLKAQLSASEISELDVKAAASLPPKETSKIRFAPVQIFLGIGLGIFFCLLCQQGENFGTRTDNYYAPNGKIYEQWIYQNGHLAEYRQDRNLDGKWDHRDYYEHGRLVRAEYDNNFDGKPDEWWTFSNEGTDTLQKDTDFNGIPDEFCTYKMQIIQEADMKPNGSKYITMREIFTNGVLSEMWRGGDSNGNFKEVVHFDPFWNPISTNQFPLQPPSS